MSKLERWIFLALIGCFAIVGIAAVNVSPSGGGTISSASFDSSQFAVSAGVVTIKDGATVSNLVGKASATSAKAISVQSGTNYIRDPVRPTIDFSTDPANFAFELYLDVNGALNFYSLDTGTNVAKFDGNGLTLNPALYLASDGAMVGFLAMTKSTNALVIGGNSFGYVRTVINQTDVLVVSTNSMTNSQNFYQAGGQTNYSGLTMAGGQFIGNGAGLTNLGHSASVSAGTGISVTTSKNSDGGTNFAVAASGSAGPMTQTNFVLNTIYTNANANPVIINVSTFLNVAAVSGAAEVDLMYSPTGGTSYTAVARSSIQTIITSLAMAYTNSIAAVVTNQGNYYFTNTSSGSGNSAGLVSGTGQITVFGGVGATGSTGASGTNGINGTNAFPITLTLSGTNAAVNAATPGGCNLMTPLWFRLTMTTNLLVQNPTGMIDGQRATFEMIQDSTGQFTAYFGTAFSFGTDLPASAVNCYDVATKRAFVQTVYNSGSGLWYVVGYLKGF